MHQGAVHFRWRTPLWRLLLVAFFLSLIFPNAHASTTKELLSAGRVDDAIEALRAQTEKSPADAETQNLLCRAYFMLEQWDRGIPACERAVELDSRTSVYQLWLGRIYGEKADRVIFVSALPLAKKVRIAFERAVELDPKNWEAHADLAEFYVEAPGIVGGGKNKARQQADALMPLNPAMSHWVAARIAEKNTDKDQASAEQEYRAEIAVSHSAVRGWVDLAIFLRHTDRLDEMEEALRHLESAPIDRPESLMDGAGMLLRTGRNYPLAAKLLRRYLTAPVEEGPAFKAHDMLGQVLEKQGDRKGAAEEYSAALALAHDYVRAQENLKRLDH
jgi:tetratricopeptide (TPR) repeat protein